MLSIFLAALVAATNTSAQQTFSEQQASRGPASNDFSYLNLTFAGRHATECGALTNENNTFDLYIHSVPTSRVCFGMTVNTYFMNDTDANLTIIDQTSNTHQLEGYQAPEEPCPAGRDGCGVRYSLTRASDFNMSTWYEQIRYSQQRPEKSEDDDDGGFGELAFRTYPDSVCSSNPTTMPKRSWNCERAVDEAECTNLGFQGVIASFSMEPVTEEERTSGTCEIAAQESDADGDSAVAKKSLLVALMSFVLTYATVRTIA